MFTIEEKVAAFELDLRFKEVSKLSKEMKLEDIKTVKLWVKKLRKQKKRIDKLMKQYPKINKKTLKEVLEEA